jgi:RNA polymerase sigma factor (sigma-70 family)
MKADGNSSSESASADEALRRLALHLAGREADAEDLAQEVRLSALRKPGLLELREWFRIVARRTLWHWSYRDRARTLRERRVARSEAQDGGLGELEAASLREFLSASVSALKEPYREVIRLHYFEDLPVDEIGRRLGRPDVTVRVQLSRGLELLRNRLEGRRERFLTLAPLVSLLSEPPRRWVRHADKRVVALGAIAAVFAVTLLFVVAGRADRGRDASAGSPEVAGVSGASLLAPETHATADRHPVTSDAPVRAAPGSPLARLSGRVLSFD